jgi:thiol:disulfide interchange protein
MRRSHPATAIACAVVALLACNFGQRTDPPPERRSAPANESPAETATAPAATPDSGFSFVSPHLSDGDLAEVLTYHAGRAAELGRRPFVLFSAEWCPSCVALESSLTDERMVEALAGTYVIRLDIDEWESRLRGTGFRVVGVPTFFEVDPEGQPTGRILTGAAWGADTIGNMAPCLKEFFHGA